MFVVPLYFLGEGILKFRKVFMPQFWADNLKCVSNDPKVLLCVARSTSRYVRLVGQESAPSECVHEYVQSGKEGCA